MEERRIVDDVEDDGEGVTLVEAVVDAKDGGYEAVEVEGGGTLGETAAESFGDVPGNSQHTHIVDETVNGDTWKCAFHVKEED